MNRVPPTRNLINHELSQLCALMHTPSDEAQPGPSRETESSELKKLKTKLELTVMDLVQHEHHKQFMIDALKANKPPPGLTQKLI